MATTKIVINNNGSVKVEGDFEIVDKDGKAYGLGAMAWWASDRSRKGGTVVLLAAIRHPDKVASATVSNTAFRGFGGPQGMMGAERVIDVRKTRGAQVGRSDANGRTRGFGVDAADAGADDRESIELQGFIVFRGLR